MEFGSKIAKQRVSRPKSGYTKNCISASQERWTLGFCMEAIKSLNSLYQYCFGFGAQENHF